MPATEHTNEDPKQGVSALIGRLAASRVALVATATVAFLAIAGCTVGYNAMATTVTLSLDGEERTVRLLGAETVDDVLAAEGVDLTSRDLVVPSLDDEVSDGSLVAVRFSRPVELTVDGETQTHWVTATDVDAALAQIGSRFDKGKLSLSRSTSIDRDGVELEVVTAKKVVVELAGAEPEKVKVAGATVEEALEELGIKVGKRDEVIPGRDKRLKKGMTIVFNDTSRKKVSVEGESFDAETITRKNDSMTKGSTNVIEPGESGVRDATYRITYVNGEEVSRKLLEQTVITEPKPRIVEVGTKVEPVNLSGVWARLAQCESGGNPRIVSSNGLYHGLYQFSVSTWRAVGGAGLPSQASPAEQTKRAQILQARSGWGQWPHCSRVLGLR